MTGIERTTSLADGPDEVWAVLADFGALASWVPMIQHACLLSEQTEGVGTVRRVQIARQTLVERVITWRPARELAYSIEGLPPMIGAARNTWCLSPSSAGCDVTLTTTIETGRNPIELLIARTVLARMAVVSELMLAGLAGATTATETP